MGEIKISKSAVKLIKEFDKLKWTPRKESSSPVYDHEVDWIRYRLMFWKPAHKKDKGGN